MSSSTATGKLWDEPLQGSDVSLLFRHVGLLAASNLVRWMLGAGFEERFVSGSIKVLKAQSNNDCRYRTKALCLKQEPLRDGHQASL